MSETDRLARRAAAVLGMFALDVLPPLACAWVAVRLSADLGAFPALVLFACLVWLWRTTRAIEGASAARALRRLYLGAVLVGVLGIPSPATARPCLGPDLELAVIEQAHPGARLIWTGFTSDRGVWLEIWIHNTGWIAYGRSSTERCVLQRGSGPAIAFGDVVGVTPDQARRLLAGEGARR